MQMIGGYLVIHCQYERISNFVIGGYLHFLSCLKEYLIL